MAPAERLVTGATASREARLRGAHPVRDNRVKALTRKPDSDAARRLMSAGADLVTATR